ncbi:divergent polysaccharide deacetylase family protein [Lyticum sinuosum]|uniref:Divergent polysaccharide deacetylase superfamily protein n=1 Tax=Lyticum sinuosum TaxID=1332059 RepID=A0AAE5AGT5_9RICK|nr:divergent polysaccharide deacetylase family protein [Lyticum sinuosum]MDZ5761162.1 Divergent polysaccharide deacetylase superfamily protein [Lyticum sinuosum]
MNNHSIIKKTSSSENIRNKISLVKVSTFIIIIIILYFFWQKFYYFNDNHNINESYNHKADLLIKDNDSKNKMNGISHNPFIKNKLSQEDLQKQINPNKEIPPISDIENKPQKKAMLSFVIIDAGMSKNENKLLFTLPNHVTLGFNPYASELRNLLINASNSGYQTIIWLPVSTLNQKNNNTGNLSLKKNSSNEENLQKLRKILTLSKGVSGVYLAKDQDITNTDIFETVIMQELTKSNIYLAYWIITKYRNFHDVNDVNDDLIIKSDNSNKTNKIMFDFILDSELEPQKTLENINNIVAQSTNLGKPLIGVIRSYPMSIKVLREWLKYNKYNNNIKFYNLSSIMDLRNEKNNNK